MSSALMMEILGQCDHSLVSSKTLFVIDVPGKVKCKCIGPTDNLKVGIWYDIIKP